MVAEHQLFIPPEKPLDQHPCGEPAEWLAREPQSPLLARMQGCSSFTKTFPWLNNCIVLYGPDGTSIVVGAGGDCLKADTPILEPTPVYRGPVTSRVDGIDVLADAVVIGDDGVVRYCQASLGCGKRLSLKGPRQFIETGIYRPKLLYPCSYAPCRTRVKGCIEVYTPWICIAGRSRSWLLICGGKGLCRFVVDFKGGVDVESDAWYIDTYTCSYPFMARMIASTLWSGRSSFKAAMEVTSSIPVRVYSEKQGPRLKIYSWLWNPQAIPVNATIRLNGYTIARIRLYNIADNLWEELKPIANTARIPLNSYGLLFVEVEARKTLI